MIIAPRLPSLEPRLFDAALLAARPSEVNAPRRFASNEFLAVGLRTGVVGFVASVDSCFLFTGDGDPPAGTSWFIT